MMDTMDIRNARRGSKQHEDGLQYLLKKKKIDNKRIKGVTMRCVCLVLHAVNGKLVCVRHTL